jgi:hypothetical protein
MTAKSVPSGTSNGPVNVEFSGERYVTLEQDDRENRDKDLIVIGVEHVAELTKAMQAAAAPAIPAPKRGVEWYSALPVGESNAPIELGINHNYALRNYVLLRQIDGADEDGGLTNSTIALDASKLDTLISLLNQLKGALA